MRAVFNGETLVNEVAFDVCRGLQHHLLGTHRADKAATDHHILCNYVTLKLCILSEYEGDTAHVALNLAIEMKLALRCYAAGDR
jgi:hypothetical protein